MGVAAESALLESGGSHEHLEFPVLRGADLLRPRGRSQRHGDSGSVGPPGELIRQLTGSKSSRHHTRRSDRGACIQASDGTDGRWARPPDRMISAIEPELAAVKLSGSATVLQIRRPRRGHPMTAAARSDPHS